MKRTRLRAFVLAALLAAWLFVALNWGLSYFYHWRVRIPSFGDGRSLTLYQREGLWRLGFWRWVGGDPKWPEPDWIFERIHPRGPEYGYIRPGTYWHWHSYQPNAEATRRPGGYGYRSIRCPHWLPLTALTILLGRPLIIAIQRRRPGVCPACGYDLRGTPANKTCPECGAAAPQ